MTDKVILLDEFFGDRLPAVFAAAEMMAEASVNLAGEGEGDLQRALSVLLLAVMRTVDMAQITDESKRKMVESFASSCQHSWKLQEDWAAIERSRAQ